MARGLLTIGLTGTGKTHATQFLDPNETYFINCANKDLPFRGSRKMYNADKKNYASIIESEKIEQFIITISEKATHVKVIVVDDAQYIMADEFVEKALEKGYDKFTMMAKHMYDIMSPRFLKSLRDDLTIIYLSHSEETKDGTKMKTIGKMLDEKVTLEGLFTVVLHTHVEHKGPGKPSTYKFLTNTDGYYIAKSPQGMFDDMLIDNNFKNVLKKMDEYYNS